jgi:hypothetical protein
VVVHANSANVDVLLDAVCVEEAVVERRDGSEVEHEKMIVFEGNGPTRSKAVFEAGPNHSAPSRFARQREGPAWSHANTASYGGHGGV